MNGPFSVMTIDVWQQSHTLSSRSFLLLTSPELSIVAERRVMALFKSKYSASSRFSVLLPSSHAAIILLLLRGIMETNPCSVAVLSLCGGKGSLQSPFLLRAIFTL